MRAAPAAASMPSLGGEMLIWMRRTRWQQLQKKTHSQRHPRGPHSPSAGQKPPLKPAVPIQPRRALLPPCQILLQQQAGTSSSAWTPPCCCQTAARPQLPFLLPPHTTSYLPRFPCAQMQELRRLPRPPCLPSVTHSFQWPCWQQPLLWPCCSHPAGSPWQPPTARPAPATKTGQLQATEWHPSMGPTGDSRDSSTPLQVHSLLVHRLIVLELIWLNNKTFPVPVVFFFLLLLFLNGEISD